MRVEAVMENLNNLIVTDITDVRTVSSPKGRFSRTNNRASYGISFCISGQITYTHKGKQYVSDTEHAVILPQGQSYTLFGDKQGLFPLINFISLNFVCDTITIFPIRDREFFIKNYEQIKALFFFEGNKAKIMSIFYDMIHRLSYNTLCYTIMPAVKYIEKNYQNPDLTNAILARECKISEIYFRNLFASQFKTTPKQFIIGLRIQKAKQLLTEGILKINVVAQQCGFSNPYHFCRVFKEKTGLTPTAYAKQNRVYKI